MKHLYLLLTQIFFLTFFLSAQTRNPGLDISRTNIWRFGWQSFTTGTDAPGLDFTNGSPVVINCGHSVGEGASTISDTTGALLLYGGYGGSGSQYLRMFNNTCDIMANSGAVGDSGWSGIGQTNLAIPKPRSPNLIYYFSTSITLKYTVVDMNLDGGKGAAILRNVQLEPLFTGVKLAAVHHCNGSDIWIVGHRFGTNIFYAYLLSDTGVTTTPVLTQIGPIANETGTDQAGRIKFSPNGNKLAIVFNGFDTIPYLFDFDKLSGIISNPVPLQKNIGDEGIAFSPDNSKLYICTTNGELLQYDLEAGSPSAIAQSRKFIRQLALQDLSIMQLGRDGKIYLSSSSQPHSYYLEVINNPNASDTLCNFQTQAVYLNGVTGYAHSLMNTVDSYFYTGTSAYPCYGDTTTVNIAANEANFGIKVYPNPFSDFATIDIPNIMHGDGKPEYRLYDALGRECKVHIVETSNGAIVHRGSVQQGIYFIAIKLFGKTQTIKLIIL